MKRIIVLTMFSASMLLVSMTATASDHYTCSPKNVAGTWGYFETATVFDPSTTPPTPYPYASVGIYSLDRHGNMEGKRTASLAGTTLRATIKGTATVNPDCTGEENLSFYNDEGILTGTATKALLYVNRGKEISKIITSSITYVGDLAIPVPIVAITRTKRVLSSTRDLPGIIRDHSLKRFFGCSNADLRGQWGTTMEGKIMTPTGAIPFGAANKAVYDSEGNYSGTQIRAVNNQPVSTVNFEGIYTVNPDCTGTKTTKTFSSGQLLNTATQDFVLVDDANEIFEIFTSNIKADNTPVPMVVTGQSQKTFPKGAQALD